VCVKCVLFNNMYERVHMYTCGQPPATAEGAYVPAHLRWQQQQQAAAAADAELEAQEQVMCYADLFD
jgi:hypothetical protein